MDNLKVCRLCLEGINNHNFETLDSVKLATLKILPLNISSAYTTNAFICSRCSDELQHTFCFKTACLDNNDYLKTFLHNDSNFTLDLEEIVVRQITIQDGVKCEEEKVCRFCLKYFDVHSFTKLNKLEEDIFLKDMLEKCLPELDLNMTTAPLMCQECMDMLQNQFNFLISCLDVEKRINNFRSSVGDQHNLSDILKLDSKHLDIDDVKMEVESDKDPEYISKLAVKEEEVFEDIEKSEFRVEIKEKLQSDVEHEETSEECIKIEENLKTELDSDETMSDGACKSGQLTFPKPEMLEKNAYGMFACTFCPHQTNRRDSLVMHYLTHTEKAEMSQFDQFKCARCDFVTKYKTSLKWHIQLHKNPTDLELFYCAECPYKSIHKKHVRRHCKTHMKSKSLSTHTYQCQFCSFTTKNKTTLEQHNKTKHNKSIVLAEKTKLNCEKCDYQSKFERNILNHMRIVHNIAKEDKLVQIYKCKWCDYKSPKLCHLQDHSLKHQSCEDVKMLNCPQCPFQTKYKNSLASHIKRHESGKKPQKRRRTDKPVTTGRKGS